MDPILIASAPRSGTSMTAGILHQHGVAVGKHQTNPKFNPKGSFENSKMKSVLSRAIADYRMPLNPLSKSPEEPEIPNLCDDLRACVQGEPWLLKETKLLWFYRNLSNGWPNAIWVLPLRRKQDSVSSILRHDVLPKRMSDSIQREGLDCTVEKAAAMYWNLCYQRQKQIAESERHVWVDTDSIARGDINEARRLVESCGLEFNERKVVAFVNREYWHA